jgi:hypothetical protein
MNVEMKLNTFVSDKRKLIFESLVNGQTPSEGQFDAEGLREAQSKGSPQLGAVRFDPHSIHFEFIYPVRQSNTAIITVTIPSPERIVFMPVPAWVIESIWQGDIDGSFHFESEARALIREFEDGLGEQVNVELFSDRRKKQRE